MRQVVRGHTAFLEQGAELMVHLDGSDVKARGDQIVGQIAPTRPELDQTRRWFQAVPRHLTDGPHQVRPRIQVVADDGG